MPTVKLSPVFQDEQLDNNGLPLAGGLLSWYIAGTLTPVTVYADSLGSAQQTQPIVLNSRGEPPNPIWLPTGQTYKALLTDSLGGFIRPAIDNIAPINDFTNPSLNEWTLFSGGVTFQDSTHFTLLGDQTSLFTPSRRLQLTVGGGYQYGTIVASVFSAGITTVQVLNDTSAITSGLTQAFYGILNSVNSSIPTVTKAPVAITAAATTAIGAANSNTVSITGTTTITAFDVAPAGLIRVIMWNAATPVTYNATSMQLMALQSLTYNPDDVSFFESLGYGNWKELAYQPIGGSLPVGSFIATLASTPPPGFMAVLTAPGTISRTTYAYLFAAIGTMFGAGDGSTTFGAPWMSPSFALLHGPASLGIATAGTVISHTHIDSGHNHPNSTPFFVNAFFGGSGTGTSSATNATTIGYANIQATGGTNNIAAGINTLYCIKY